MEKFQKTKTILCKDNGRSGDATSANFILGCRDQNNNPYCQYCYVHRFNRPTVYINTNIHEILLACNNWVNTKPLIKTPNQVHNDLYLVDIGCDVDINKYWNKYDWNKVFDYFKNHPRMGATFATKWYNPLLLNYDSNKKIRVRHSLIPENIRTQVEKSTSLTLTRIKGAQKLFEAGWEVHFNLSPVIYYDNYLNDYKELFNIINNEVSQEFKDQCGLEIIFLTHNANLNKINLEKGLNESLLWNPKIQEEKISKYGGNNVRYKWQLKEKLINELTQLINEDLKIKIRYIF
jgi:spore photoproduct lyase